MSDFLRLSGAAVLAGLLAACAGEPAPDAVVTEPEPMAAALPAPVVQPAPAAVPLPPGAPRANPGPVEPLRVQTARGPVDFQVELADSEAERQQGLMFRSSMPANRGMIFVFDAPAPQSFWMRNTYIPLDIIYIGADGRIVSIAKNTATLSEAAIPSAAPAQYVLEINAGLSDRLGIAPGDRVSHRLLP